MPYFKDIQNKVHFLDSEDFIHLLPKGSVEIQEEEAIAISAPPPTKEEVAQAEESAAKAAALEALLNTMLDEQVAKLSVNPDDASVSAEVKAYALKVDVAVKGKVL